MARRSAQRVARFEPQGHAHEYAADDPGLEVAGVIPAPHIRQRPNLPRHDLVTG